MTDAAVPVRRFARMPHGFDGGFTLRMSDGTSPSSPAAARALADALGARDAEVALCRQVHGNLVHVLDEPPGPREVRIAGEGDALVTSRAGRLVAVASADCVPILLVAPGLAAAVHAGWRGTAAGVVDAALDVLERRGASPGAIRAFLGPSISRDRYEVGPEVVSALLAALRGADPGAGAVRPGPGDRSHVDVAAFNRARLLARGVAPDSIEESGMCTATEAGLPSYRRDGAGAGRVLTGVVMVAGPPE